MNATDRTPADLLRSALAADPARPLVTFYDDATGERVELSVATFANWVAKTANLLQGELSAEPGDRVALLLAGALADGGVAAGVCVGGRGRRGRRGSGDGRHRGERTGHAGRGSGVLRGADRSRAAAARGRFPQAPSGFADYAVEVPSQGDRFVAYAPVDPEEAALVVAGREFSGAEVVERARAEAGDLGLTGPGSRLLSGLPYDTWEGLAAGLYGPLATGGPWCCVGILSGWVRMGWPRGSRVSGSRLSRADAVALTP